MSTASPLRNRRLPAIFLRKIEPADLPFLYIWENDKEVWPDGNIHNPLSQQDLRDYIEQTTGDAFLDKQLRLIITDGTTTYGAIDLFDLDNRNRKAAIGMYIAPEFRGKGVGRQAVELLEEVAFKHLGLNMIYAVISTANQASSQLYKSLSYTPCGPLKSWTLESDAMLWQKLNIYS